MKIAVLAHGSRGDVQPPLILAHQLAARGHMVTIAVPRNFTALAAGLGARVAPLATDARAALDEGGLQRSLRRGRTLRFFREAFRNEEARFAALTESAIEACAGAELLVLPALLEDLGVSIAEAGAQRVAFAQPFPIWPNRRYPSLLMMSTWGMPGWANRLSHALAELGARPLVRLANQVRERLGLAATRRRPALGVRTQAPPVFYWVPEQVLPRPDDFGANHRYTGYWTPPPTVRAAFGEHQPPAELVDFLARGAPPVYVGLGSMPVVDEVELEIVRTVAERLDLRVVVGRGWSSTASRSDERILVVGEVDHEWLLPRCLAAVHHGGTGTTGATLRAGIPAVVTPVFADQPMWARRVVELGVGTQLAFRRLSAPRLEAALKLALSDEVRARARAFGAELSALPDGAELTARLIEEEGAGFPIPRR